MLTGAFFVQNPKYYWKRAIQICPEPPNKLDLNDYIVYNIVNNVVNTVERRKVMDNVNKLLQEAIQETENIKEGEIFLVKDLFKGYVWNRIEFKNRLLLGILFLNYVHQVDGPLCAIEKTSSHQQRYQKIAK